MKKEDLRDLMVIETRNGNRYLIVNDAKNAIRETSQMELITHNSDLTYSPLDGLDIMKVFEPRVAGFKSMLTNCYDPIWERKEPRELTVAEIEELLGYPVKVVK